MKRSNKHVIQCSRAGAIGDIIMTTPTIRELRRKNPDSLIRYVTEMPDVLINNRNIDELSFVRMDCDTEIIFEYPLKSGYPKTPLTRHLAHEFAACSGLEIESITGDLSFNQHELSMVKSIMMRFPVPVGVIHIKAGWSPYKDWSVNNWQKIVNHYAGQVVFVQIGEAGEPQLDNVLQMVGKISLRISAACIAMADFLVGGDSFPNHVAGVCKKPAVILFGSTSPVGSGYPTAINLWSGEDCSPCYREYMEITMHKAEPCPFDVKCQPGIAVDQVISAIDQILSLKVRMRT